MLAKIHLTALQEIELSMSSGNAIEHIPCFGVELTITSQDSATFAEVLYVVTLVGVDRLAYNYIRDAFSLR